MRAPMAVPEKNSAVYRWLRKPVLKSRLLDDMEDPSKWSHRGDGELCFTKERCISGEQSIRLISPTKPAEFRDTGGRPFGTAHLRREFDGEDWSEFNRLSFWVYPTAPGFYVLSLFVQLEGSARVPDQFEKDWLHHFLVKPGQWNHIVWEIEHLPRHRITALEFVYRLQGNEPGAADTVCFDFDRLELQYVEPDHFEGWRVAPGAIALSHTGYRPGSPKLAISTGLPGDRFRVIDLDTSETVWTGSINVQSTPLGTFQVMDFTDLRARGRYAIQVGETLSRPFRIDEDIWLSTVWKVLNFFYCERCGAEVPGVHGVCHQDWLCSHGDKRILINGGWHDAGDLSQNAVNTAEATYAMLSLAHRLRPDPAQSELVARLLEEARWGLNWILKTRFGDGYRSRWAVMDFWTDGVMGTVDDFIWEAQNDPFTNFHAAAAEALASVVLRETDPRLASYALKAAADDYRWAMEGLTDVDVETASAAVFAATEMYRATGDRAFLDDAARLAQTIVRSQDRELRDWPYPLTGFFYTDPTRQRILHYPHLSYDQLPAVALGQLCMMAPGHPDWMEWYTTVALYSDYLMVGSELTAPYRMLPAGVYRLDDADVPTYEEQLRKGIRLDDRHFFRRFPVWTLSRGNLAIMLSQAKALSVAAHLRRKPALLELAERQLEWTVGMNPFCQSLMYGEGFDFQPLYSAMSGDIVGALPVGIQTRRNEDIPYWPTSNCYNYKEVWVHPAARWLSLVDDLALVQDAADGRSDRVAAGAHALDKGSVVLEITARQPLRCRLRSYNLENPDEVITLDQGVNRLVRTLADRKKPWLAVITGEDDASIHLEVGGLRPSV